MSWGVYWVGLLAVTLGPAVPAVLRATSGDNQGSMSASLGDVLQLIVAEKGTTIWSLTASVSEVGWWVLGPPLLLWAGWLMRRRRGRDEAVAAPEKFAELPFGRANDIPVDRAAHERVRRPGESGSPR